MGHSNSEKTGNIRLSHRFSEAFREFQEKIRDRAYHLSLGRDRAEGDPMGDWLKAQAELSHPVRLEVKEQKKNTVVEVEVKGFAPDEIEIEVEGNVLQIFGSHSETTSRKKRHDSASTSKTQAFFQTVQLETPVDVDHSHARLYKNGKLKVVLPKII